MEIAGEAGEGGTAVICRTGTEGARGAATACCCGGATGDAGCWGTGSEPPTTFSYPFFTSSPPRGTPDSTELRGTQIEARHVDGPPGGLFDVPHQVGQIHIDGADESRVNQRKAESKEDHSAQPAPGGRRAGNQNFPDPSLDGKGVQPRHQRNKQRKRQQQADQGGTPEYRRSQESNILYVDGLLAAYKGDYAGARAKAQEFMKLVEPSSNPRKNELAHTILGMADLLQKNYAAAAAHLAEGNPNDPMVTFRRAQALEGVGKSAEAKALYKRVATNNFNGVGVALTKKEAARRAK